MANAVTGKKSPALNASCEALVQLAEPGDAYSAFTASMNASAVAGHIKTIEQKFGLKVCCSSHDAPCCTSGKCTFKAQYRNAQDSQH